MFDSALSSSSPSTLSLHDALPILSSERILHIEIDLLAIAAQPIGFGARRLKMIVIGFERERVEDRAPAARSDRKCTRLNSSHVAISYAVFCLKKKNNL